MLAIVFILERFEQYVYGRHTGVETYREPLIPIHKKTAADATQNTKMRVQFKVQKGYIEMYLVEQSHENKDRKFTVTQTEDIFQIERSKTDYGSADLEGRL